MELLGKAWGFRLNVKGGSNAIQIDKTDLAALRNKLDVPETDTIAVGKTDVKGLDDIIFEGQSPKVRSEAGLPDVKVTGKSNFVIQNGQCVE